MKQRKKKSWESEATQLRKVWHKERAEIFDLVKDMEVI